MVDTDQGLTKTYNALKGPAVTARAEHGDRIVHLCDLHVEMDRAVLAAYVAHTGDPTLTDIEVPPTPPPKPRRERLPPTLRRPSPRQALRAQRNPEPKLMTDAKQHRTAIVYDFDGTLAPGNIQEHSFLPELDVDIGEFWRDVGEQKQLHDVDEILVYMRLMLERAKEKSVPVTKEALARHGESTPLFDGVRTWFARINQYAAEEGLDLEHYIVSSGNEEIIRGSPIAEHFAHIYGSKFIFDEEGKAVWPGTSVNYTTKTQYLFRINKGIPNHWDRDAINRFVPMDERPVPFTRMLYIGDGDTDIPSMKMVRHQGGFSIAVFDPKKWHAGPSAQSKIHRLIAEDRVHFVAPADYRQGSQLEVIVKGILGRFALRTRSS